MSCFAAALALALSGQHVEPPKRSKTELRAMFAKLEPFMDSGILIGARLQECARHNNLSGYFVATSCHATIETTKMLLNERLPPDVEERRRQVLGGLHESYKDLLHLIEEVAPELRVLGADMDAVRRDGRIVFAASGEFWFQCQAPALGFPSFADVPKGHWAAKAVSHLKAVGVVKGYPSRGFVAKSKA